VRRPRGGAGELGRVRCVEAQRRAQEEALDRREFRVKRR